ncbi:hypothetical protein QL285_001111 [Trifolium repens]|nr:hypothetical protein QL285_001111 [Trifolium repens]
MHVFHILQDMLINAPVYPILCKVHGFQIDDFGNTSSNFIHGYTSIPSTRAFKLRLTESQAFKFHIFLSLKISNTKAQLTHMKKVLTIASTSLSLVPSGGISICHNIGTSGFSKMSIVSNKVTL